MADNSKFADKDRIVTIGILSDTHGLLRPEAVQVLSDVDMIFHAGDFDTPVVLRNLMRIATVYGVRGNMDKGEWSKALPEMDLVQVGQYSICVLHELSRLDLDPVVAGIHVVISGHTHQAEIKKANNILYFNPGGAGYRRFNYPITIGKITIKNNIITPQIITLSL